MIAMAQGAEYSARFRIAATHPCLPGHFPGRPLVPGVVLLEEVALALRAWRGRRLARVLEAKFLAPLRPEQEAVVRLRADGACVRFDIRHDDTPLARGRIQEET